MPSSNPLREVPPDQFVQARNALARQLRERGDAEGARRVAALRRPSAVLFIVNQLGTRAPEAVEDLIESTRRAGRAQVQGASGDELREAMRKQKDAAQRVLAEAQQSAADAGLALTLEQQRRIQETLQTAASAQPEALREGSLEHELSPAGFNALLSGAAGVTAKTAGVTAKAAAHKRTFVSRVDEQKKRAAEARDRQLREREIRHAQQAAHRLSARAAQLEKVARRATAAADQARTRAEAARREADAAEAQLLQLRTRT